MRSASLLPPVGRPDAWRSCFSSALPRGDRPPVSRLRTLPRVKFSQATMDALGWYVYMLSDPADQHPFYIGKGTGPRAFQHAKDAKDRADHPELQSRKHARILEIQAMGREVSVDVLRHHLRDEHEAYEIESASIDLVGRLRPRSLLNLVSGRHSEASGLISADEAEIRYAAPLMPDPGVPVVLVSLNHSWYPGMTDEELEEWTARWWRAVQTPPYVVGVHRTIARSVFRITGITDRKKGDRDWESDVGRPHPRHGFVVAPAPEMRHVIGSSVDGLLGNQNRWSFRYIRAEHFAVRDSALTAEAPPP